MRIFFVLDETVYHPAFMSKFLEKSPDEIVGAAIVTKMPARSSLDKYFIKRWYCFRLTEILKLLLLKYEMRLRDLLVKKTKDGRYFSLRTFFKDNNIECFDVALDIHKPEYLQKIRDLKPDVIFSSNPLIFKKEILSVPSKCCLNRHFALLPSYKGLFAVFHAYAQGEDFTGCSIHLMDEKIDSGDVIAQEKVAIKSTQTLHQLHGICFDVAVDCLLKALDKVRKGDYTPIHSGAKPSYYSWPTPEEWRLFRNRGGRVI